MIHIFLRGGERREIPVDATSPWALPSDVTWPDVIWIDMLTPTAAEESAVEQALSLSVPTREEMAELEASSRLYRENGGVYMTADVVVKGDTDLPTIAPVAFVLTTGPLITVRYSDPKPFSSMAEKLMREPDLCASAPALFLNLMEAIVDRASDILLRNADRVDEVSNYVFSENKTVGFDRLITRMGRAHIANARIEQSLAGLSRIFTYIAADPRFDQIPEGREHLKSLSGDAASLIAHNQAVAAGINFQLSAALGLINIEQSSIIKIFSVAAVAFMPPTLIASIYGMNFIHMPELEWMAGYPLVIVAMVISGVSPLLWFKRKGWL